MPTYRTGDHPLGAISRTPAVQPGSTVHREAVLVEDTDHVLPCAVTDVVHVDTRHHATVEVWFVARPDATDKTRVVVLGTGHPVPAGAVHLGTVIDPGTGTGLGLVRPGALVWHLWALADDTEAARS